MEENRRFRNHFSIVFERLGTGFVAFAMLFLYEGVEMLGELGVLLKDIQNSQDEVVAVIMAGVCIFALFAIILGLQIFRWSKTYISIQDQAIVIEVNTLNRKKNTIGIKNISNINLEQNLFEMLVGTCKVKMDTNSMSTADATDVKIVLKKDKAQKFQAQILSMITEKDMPMEVVPEKVMSVPGAGLEEMLIQGIFSLKLISIPLVALSMIGIWATISEVVQDGRTSENILGVLSSILVIGLFGISVIWDIIKGFIEYYGFRIQRQEERLYISYGLIKKVSYTIPVDKINAVKLVQSPQARVAGRYMAELINVGMGDDEKKAQSFFLLYDKKSRIIEKMKVLLPEFSDELESETYRQSAKVWCVWLLPAIIYMSGTGIALAVMNELPGEGKLIGIAVISTITFILMLYVTGNYFTRGYYIGKTSLKIVDGNFGKRILLVKYPKIQYIQTKQNFLAKYFGMQKGEIYLLASTMNRVHNIPYFPEADAEKIRKQLLG